MKNIDEEIFTKCVCEFILGQYEWVSILVRNLFGGTDDFSIDFSK